MEEGRELPVGWVIVRLEEIGAWGSGGTPKRTNQSLYANGTIPWLVIGDLNDGLVTTAASAITEEALDSSAAKIVPRDSLLVAMYGSIGKLGITGIECATNQAIAHCKPFREVVELQYLFNALMHVKEDLIAKGQGGAQQNISQGILRDQEIPLAPLNEQRRIAAKLDTTLAAVDDCRQRLDGFEALLKRFRQSVLAAATSGELTREWREERRTDEEWKNIPLGDILLEGPKNGIYKPKSDYGHGTRILRIDNFYDGTVVDWLALKRLSLSDEEKVGYGLAVGDIVVNRVNSIAYLGKTALVDLLPEACVFESNMMRIRLKTSLASPSYINFFLCSPRGIHQLRLPAKHAINQASINQQDVKRVMVALPSIQEQEEIVRRTQELLSLAAQLEARLTSARKLVERLTPAVLAKAFRGELVPQNPSDEPASVLLERNRAARQVEAAAGKPSRRGRRKAVAHPEENDPPAVPAPPNHLARLLQECGALSERALLAASELDPRRFQQQLALELEAGNILEVHEEGESLWMVQSPP